MPPECIPTEANVVSPKSRSPRGRQHPLRRANRVSTRAHVYPPDAPKLAAGLACLPASPGGGSVAAATKSLSPGGPTATAAAARLFSSVCLVSCLGFRRGVLYRQRTSRSFRLLCSTFRSRNRLSASPSLYARSHSPKLPPDPRGNRVSALACRLSEAHAGPLKRPCGAVFPVQRLLPAPAAPTTGVTYRPHPKAPQVHSYRLPWSSAVLFATQLSEPLPDSFSPLSNPGISDPRILGKRTLFPYRRHSHAFLILFKQQAVPCAHSQPPPDFPGHRDLSLACYLCQLSHGRAWASLPWIPPNPSSPLSVFPEPIL